MFLFIFIVCSLFILILKYNINHQSCLYVQLTSFAGSLTDSVCTAYENKSIKLVDKSEMSNSKSISDAETIKSTTSDSESAFAPVSNLTSMLGGEFYS